MLGLLIISLTESLNNKGPLAQTGRAADSNSVGCGFESRMAFQKLAVVFDSGGFKALSEPYLAAIYRLSEGHR